MTKVKHKERLAWHEQSLMIVFCLGLRRHQLLLDNDNDDDDDDGGGDQTDLNILEIDRIKVYRLEDGELAALRINRHVVDVRDPDPVVPNQQRTSWQSS